MNAWRAVEGTADEGPVLAEAGLRDGFHQEAAEIFRRCPHLPSATADGDVLSKVLAALTA